MARNRISGDPMTDEPSSNPHYYLGAGEIMFANTETSEIGVTRLNAMLTSETGNITAAELGKLQQAMQVTFFRRLDEEARKGLTVVDVVIYGINYLGQMTPDEFHNEADVSSNNQAKSSAQDQASVDPIPTPFD